MGKGSKRRPENTEAFDKSYESIFGESDVRRGRFYFDKNTGELTNTPQESEYNEAWKDLGVHLKGGGFPTKKHSRLDHHKKNLEKNPFYTSLEDHQEVINKRTRPRD